MGSFAGYSVPEHRSRGVAVSPAAARESLNMARLAPPRRLGGDFLLLRAVRRGCEHVAWKPFNSHAATFQAPEAPSGPPLAPPQRGTLSAEGKAGVAAAARSGRRAYCCTGCATVCVCCCLWQLSRWRRAARTPRPRTSLARPSGARSSPRLPPRHSAQRCRTWATTRRCCPTPLTRASCAPP